MRILYETNGLGFLGWIVDLPGAYIRGRTIGEAREMYTARDWVD
jgi:predicted RNase H-like HicB family nuclease